MKNVILIGMPGCGKTTVIDLCKQLHGREVWDTDEYIESTHGKISDIFAKFGEEYFRNIETEAVWEICKKDNCFISTGGGCVMREENVRIFKESGTIIYLKAKIETLLNRLEGDNSRPLLFGNKGERLAELFNMRAPVYESVADIVIDTDGLTPQEVLENIFIKLNGKIGRV